MGDSCDCCAGGDGSGGRGGRSSLEGSGGSDDSVEFMAEIESLMDASVIDDRLDEHIARFQMDCGELLDQPCFARPFIKGTCSVDKHEFGGDTGSVDRGGGSKNFNNIQ